MCFLSDTDIEQLLSPSSRDQQLPSGLWKEAQNKLLIHPFKEVNLTPVGYDFTVGDTFLSYSRKEPVHIVEGGYFDIQPHETVLVKTEEYLGMPKSKVLAGMVKSKVSVVSKGISHISTTIDHDWEGHLLIAITNQQSYAIKFRRGDSLCTAIFISSKSPATRSGGKLPGRTEIVNRNLEQWLHESRQRKPSLFSQLLPTIVMILVVIFVTGIGILLFGARDGFGEAVALAAAIAAILQPAIQNFLNRRG